jgi:ABC-type lipoprotein release transport system permease subunit
VWGYSFDPPTGATFTLWGADSVPRASLERVDGELAEEDPRKVGEGTCIVGQGVADERFLWVGDRLPLKGADGTLFAPRVRGVFTTESSVLTHDLVILPTATLRRVFAMDPAVATDLVVEIAQPAEVATVARKIQELWPDVRTISREQILSTYDAVFDWRGGVWAAILLSVVAAFAILVWDKASGLSAEEYRTLGLLKAVGWSTRNVMELCFWQGAIVSAVSLLTGLVLAQVHLVWLDGALFARLLRGWSVLFPPFDVRPGLDAYTLMLCLPLAVLPYVAASLLPSWRAAITDPDSILRS